MSTFSQLVTIPNGYVFIFNGKHKFRMLQITTLGGYSLRKIHIQDVENDNRRGVIYLLVHGTSGYSDIIMFNSTVPSSDIKGRLSDGSQYTLRWIL
jgi:hypothetical protein